MVTDHRLQQLANDRNMCNISEEVRECLRELIGSRTRIRQFNKELHEEINDAARAAQDEATWRQIQGDEYGSY